MAYARTFPYPDIPKVAYLYDAAGRKVSSPKVNYTYNGKEWQQETGHYDYGARPYDPVIARWNMVDPLADSYHAYSPYNYALNDPIGKLDPNGLWVENASGWTTNDGDKIAEFVKQLKANEEKRGDLLVNTPGTIIRKDAKGNLTRSEVAKGDAATDAVLDQAFEFAVGFTPLGFYFDARAAITGVDMSGEELSPFWRIAGIVPFVSETRRGAKIVKSTVAAKGGGKNFSIISDNLLKKSGLNAHKIKMEWLGDRAKISRYDLYKDTKTGEILILQKGGKGKPIQTGEFIK